MLLDPVINQPVIRLAKGLVKIDCSLRAPCRVHFPISPVPRDATGPLLQPTAMGRPASLSNVLLLSFSYTSSLILVETYIFCATTQLTLQADTKMWLFLLINLLFSINCTILQCCYCMHLIFGFICFVFDRALRNVN